MHEYSLITLEEVESTNAYALEFIQSFDDKTVINALIQKNGRGRYNRHWISDDSSNIFATFVLKPHNIERYPFSNLTQYLSVVVCNVLEKSYNIVTSIKWPNDILVDDCKIAGILAETNVQNNKINGIALGLGLNVNLKRETIERIDQKATSMAEIRGFLFNTKDVLKRICDEFYNNYDRFIAKGFKFIENDYIKRCNFLGKTITIREENKQYLAKFIDDTGLLVVQDELNREKKIITGDVLCV